MEDLSNLGKRNFGTFTSKANTREHVSLKWNMCLSNSQKIELSNEDLEGRILKQQEENHRLRNLNQELEEHIKKLKNDK